jgi:hypothetical protein
MFHFSDLPFKLEIRSRSTMKEQELSIVQKMK